MMGEGGVCLIRDNFLEYQIRQVGGIMGVDENKTVIIRDVFRHFRQKLKEIEQGQASISSGNLFPGKLRRFQSEPMGELVQDVPTRAVVLAIAVAIGDDERFVLHKRSFLIKTSPGCGEVYAGTAYSTAAGSGSDCPGGRRW